MKATETFDEITVFGARGHSLMILRGLEEHWQGRVRIRALIDDIENGFQHAQLNVPVLSSDERMTRFPDLPVLLTVTNPALRSRVVARLEAEGATLATAHLSRAAEPGSVSPLWPWLGLYAMDADRAECHDWPLRDHPRLCHRA